MSGTVLLPDPKAEGWRFTPVEALSAPRFERAAPPARLESLAGKALCPLGLHTAALVNGRWEPKHSVLQLPQGVTVEPWDGSEAAPAGRPLAALAAAEAQGGVLVRVGRRVRADKPIHLVHLAQGADRAEVSHARALVVLEEGASAELVEEFLSFGGAPTWKNSFSVVRLGADASLKHYRVVREGPQGRHTAALEVSLAARARYESHLLQLGGFFSREDLRARLEGEGAECVLNGLALLSGAEFADSHSEVEHAAPHGTTRQLYKAVLDGKSRFVFDGLISVKPGAQKTDAQVYNKNLLLSEDARVNTNPEFKILADDVSCKHGGAVGQMSPEALFYLRSRGVSAEDARRLLVYAFGSEMVERVGLEPLRVALADALHGRMPEEAA